MVNSLPWAGAFDQVPVGGRSQTLVLPPEPECDRALGDTARRLQKTTTDSSITTGDNDLSVAASSCHNQCSPPPRLEAKTSEMLPHRYFLVLAVEQRTHARGRRFVGTTSSPVAFDQWVKTPTPNLGGFPPSFGLVRDYCEPGASLLRAQIPKEDTSPAWSRHGLQYWACSSAHR